MTGGFLMLQTSEQLIAISASVALMERSGIKGFVTLPSTSLRCIEATLTPTIRLELRDILSPRVELSEPYRFDSDETKYINPKRISDIVRWEVVLSTAHPHSALSDMQNKKLWNDVLPVGARLKMTR